MSKRLYSIFVIACVGGVVTPILLAQQFLPKYYGASQRTSAGIGLYVGSIILLYLAWAWDYVKKTHQK